jgi:hypothetical protein
VADAVGVGEAGEIGPQSLDASGFEQAFGERLDQVLDLRTWHGGTDLAGLYERLELDARIGEALATEDHAAAAIRASILPELRDRSRRGAPPLAGVWRLELPELERVHKGTLFSGQVEACDSTVHVHESLPLTVIQIGISLVGYQGDEGTWSHRLYRRDLQASPSDAVELARQLLELRDPRPERGRESGQHPLAELGRRGIAAYAERSVLTNVSSAAWRMGRGNPAPYELLTGAGAMDLVVPACDLLQELLTKHRRFVFVPTRGYRSLLTIGRALAPLEFAVVHRLRTYIEDIVVQGHLRGHRLRRAQDFVGDVGESVVVGVFRASRHAPPYVFYAPASDELCAQAAAVALADAVIQEHRGYPMLLDMARQFCKAAFGREEFLAPIQAAYAEHGEPVVDLSTDQP